ncbi:MAG TPA: hypothetical protein VL961_07490, partial [Acidimicrobiales bacterium]|nr:hypothetical protein [Acidimicrobiales bacterium]
RGHRLAVLGARSEPGAAAGGPPGTLHGTAVATGLGVLHLTEVQPESKKPMSAEEWLRGIRLSEGERFGSD